MPEEKAMVGRLVFHIARVLQVKTSLNLVFCLGYRQSVCSQQQASLAIPFPISFPLKDKWMLVQDRRRGSIFTPI